MSESWYPALINTITYDKGDIVPPGVSGSVDSSRQNARMPSGSQTSHAGYRPSSRPSRVSGNRVGSIPGVSPRQVEWFATISGASAGRAFPFEAKKGRAHRVCRRLGLLNREQFRCANGSPLWRTVWGICSGMQVVDGMIACACSRERECVAAEMSQMPIGNVFGLFGHRTR